MSAEERQLGRRMSAEETETTHDVRQLGRRMSAEETTHDVRQLGRMLAEAEVRLMSGRR